MKRRTLDVIRVFRSPLDRRRGRIRAGSLDIACALGSGGVTRSKREGDGCTPAGRMRILAAHYRPDRIARPCTGVPARPIRPGDGWCDDPASRRYNRPVPLPAAESHERMWRDDALYDLVLDLDWNRTHPRKGRGSAIFLHASRPGFTPTEGCVAIPAAALRRLVAWIGPRTRIEILG